MLKLPEIGSNILGRHLMLTFNILGYQHFSMDTSVYHLLVISLLAVIVTSSNIGNTKQDINLEIDGGYTDLLVAIDEKVSEDLNILTKLQV